ncbi:unnamed protein product [Scytosiphon promiscuus]
MPNSGSVLALGGFLSSPVVARLAEAVIFISIFVGTVYIPPHFITGADCACQAGRYFHVGKVGNVSLEFLKPRLLSAINQQLGGLVPLGLQVPPCLRSYSEGESQPVNSDRVFCDPPYTVDFHRICTTHVQCRPNSVNKTNGSVLDL